MQIMLDTETMGNGSNSPIVSIGAVAFDMKGIHDEFYRVIGLEEAMSTGAEMDPPTVLWWMQQSKDAIQSTFFQNEEAVTTKKALKDLGDFITSNDAQGVWGNGVAFDNVIISNAARRLGIEPIWPFWLDRCYRTVKSINPEIPVAEYGTAHNALDDAKKQALHLIEIMKSK